ncbi:MAG: tRNA-intron lyase [archaeon]
MPKIKPFKVAFLKSKLISRVKEARDLYSQSRFGEIDGKNIVYSLVEVLYLLEKKKVNVLDKTKKLTFSQLLEKTRKLDENISVKYTVFKDMRKRGYLVKTALKFGAEFRVYDKGKKPGKSHARWILFPIHESEALRWHDFAAKNRVAHSTKKNLLIAIVDDEGSVTYYESVWTRP